MYRLDWDESLSNRLVDFPTVFGAAHGLDIALLFGTDTPYAQPFRAADREATDRQAALGAALRSYWGEFAWTGTPGRGVDGRLPPWPRWDDGKTLLLDTPAGGGIRVLAGRLSADEFERRIDRDPLLAADPLERCRVHASMFGLIGHAAGLDDPQRTRARGCAPN